MLFALFGTIISESLVAFLFGFRDRVSLLKIALMNAMTNTTVNYIALVNYNLGIFGTGLFFYLFLEALVVVSEWRMLVYAFPKRKGNMLFLSFLMNLFSFLIGLLVFGIPG